MKGSKMFWSQWYMVCMNVDMCESLPEGKVSRGLISALVLKGMAYAISSSVRVIDGRSRRAEQ
eukprot:2357864-Amphidinium_carterae.1